MELPKNITQIGESDRNCKIYVEDYVVSYIKQLNHVACNKELAVALYGIRKQEENITYIFIYGAGKLDFLHKEARHLSQAQYQEIDKLRKKYFANYDFQGYRILNGEMVEGFHICEQDICRYVAGYAQFYEKNDCMLAYMLDTRLDEPKPEVVNREKYEEVRKRQEERKLEQSKPPVPKEQAVKEPKPLSENGFKKMRMSTAAAFGVLCLVGLSMVWEGQGMEGIMNTARAAMDDLTEQKVPDSQMVMNTKVQNSTLIAQDKLAEAMQQEGTKVTPENSSLNSETSDGITQGQQLTTNKEMTQTPVQTTSTDVAPIAEGGQTAGTSAGEAQNAGSEGGQTAGASAGETQTTDSEGGQTAGTSAGETQNADSEGRQTAGASAGEAQNADSEDSQTASASAGGTQTTDSEGDQMPDTSAGGTQNADSEGGQTAGASAGEAQNADSEDSQTASASAGGTQTTDSQAAPTAYMIQEGDTLIGISIFHYGNDSMVQDICALNQITNPDDIKIGQKILLP